MKEEKEMDKTVAEYMADIFEENSSPDRSGLSQEGYNQIKAVFGNVPEENRGDVYIEFLAELQKRGIHFDNAMAQ